MTTTTYNPPAAWKNATPVERATHLYECFTIEGANRICDEEGITLDDAAEGYKIAQARKEERAISRMIHGSPEYGSVRREQERVQIAEVLTDGSSISPASSATRLPGGVQAPSVSTSETTSMEEN